MTNARHQNLSVNSIVFGNQINQVGDHNVGTQSFTGPSAELRKAAEAVLTALSSLKKSEPLLPADLEVLGNEARSVADGHDVNHARVKTAAIRAREFALGVGASLTATGLVQAIDMLLGVLG